MRSYHSWWVLFVAVFVSGVVRAEPFPGVSDKTLVVWALPANLTQQGGSVLTLDEGHFDGIVFGELTPAKWMAGSELFQRTQKSQESFPVETAGPDTLVQLAVVYAGQKVTVYRNGELYSEHTVAAPVRFSAATSAVIGLRHLDARDKACFAGQIDDARIYDRALSQAQIKALIPNQPSQPMPIAWWHFEEGEPVDQQGAFPPGKLVGKAKIQAGRLHLDGEVSYLVTPLPADRPRFKATPLVADEWILNYHLMHPGNESLPGDPNAAFCLDGTYHLHYIVAHPWRGEQSFSFMHVTSPDMLHWTWQATKLQPAFTGHGMFSGTGFLTKEGQPAAIYHGQASGRNQIAIAQDRALSAWHKPYPVEVHDRDGSPANINHWDPDCFQIGDTYYAISGGPNPPLMKSQDLRTWTLVGDFLDHQLPDVTIGEDISCPNFFPLGDQWMLLCISHPLGCRYYLGDWDAQREKFVPQQHGRMNWKRDEQRVYGLFHRTDFFAPESVLTPDGRRVMWAWLTTVGPQGELLNKTVQSLPRELSLSLEGELQIRPLRELASLRGAVQKIENLTLAHPLGGFGDRIPPAGGDQLQRLATLPGQAAELEITIPREQALRKLFGFVLYSDGQGNGLPILFRPETGTIRVGSTEAPFAVADLPDGEDVELRIYVDEYLVEVFVNGRQAVVAGYLGDRQHLGIDGFTLGASTNLKSLHIWPIAPTNEGFLKARQSRVWEPQSE